MILAGVGVIQARFGVDAVAGDIICVLQTDCVNLSFTATAIG